jgi:hypothetical protein
MEFGIECGSKVVKSVEQEHDLDELMHEMDAESGSDSEDDAPDTPVEGGGGGRDASSGAGGLLEMGAYFWYLQYRPPERRYRARGYLGWYSGLTSTEQNGTLPTQVPEVPTSLRPCYVLRT